MYPQTEAWAVSSPYQHHLNSILAGSMEKDRQRLLGTDLVELFLSIILTSHSFLPPRLHYLEKRTVTLAGLRGAESWGEQPFSDIYI